MTNIIVAFSRQEDARNIKNIVTRNGFQVVAVCTSGSQAINSLEELNSGIVISGYRFEDMMFQDILDCMPEGFEMLLVASASRLGGQAPPGAVYLPMPLKVHDLISTLEMMCRSQDRRKRQLRRRPAHHPRPQALLLLLLLHWHHQTHGTQRWTPTRLRCPLWSCGAACQTATRAHG